MSLRRTMRWFVALLVTLVNVTAALAQQKPAEAPPADKGSWVLSYALVILAVALGLMAVCRPGSRTKDVKITEE
jgi:hypothetical protein